MTEHHVAWLQEILERSRNYNKSPAFQMYVTDWLGSKTILAMSPAQEGAYVRLCCCLWDDEDMSLPDDDTKLARMSRLNDEWSTTGIDVKACFCPHPFKPGFLTQPKLIEVRHNQFSQQEAGSRGGKASVEAKRKRKLSEQGSENQPSPSLRLPSSPSPLLPGSPSSKRNGARDQDGVGMGKDQTKCYEAFKAAWDAINERSYTTARHDFVQLSTFLKEHGYGVSSDKAVKLFLDLLDTAVRTHEAARKLTNPDKWDRFPDSLAQLCQRVNHYTPANLTAVNDRVRGIEEARRNRAQATGQSSDPPKRRVTIERLE